MEWFRHDLSAHDDVKVRKLLYKYGICAYGAFWLIVELLYKNGGSATEQDINDEFEMMDAEGMKDILSQSGLFEIAEDGSWSSKRVNDEIFFQEDSRRKRSEAGIRGNDIRWAEHRKAIAEQSQCDSSAIANHRKSSQNIAPYQTIPIKKDISLSKDSSISKENGRAVFQKPTVDEVRAYCDERGNSVNAETFVDFYTSKGWKVGNTPMKDWKAAVRTWERAGSRTPQAQRMVRHKMETDKAVRSRAVNPDGTLNLLGGNP